MREMLAALAHEQWSGWMRYMFGKGLRHSDGSITIPASLVNRWDRQMDTPYSNLTEHEKQSDRNQADKVIAALEEVE